MSVRLLCLWLLPVLVGADEGATWAPAFLGIRGEFLLFGLTLLGIALFHRHALLVAASGLMAVIGWRWGLTGFPEGAGMLGLGKHLAQEWVLLVNLFLVLTGFDQLAHHFSQSRLPVMLPRYLPRGRMGAMALLGIVGVLSGVLDNIAAALIGTTIANSVFRGHVHIGYVAAIVAASNAGGAGSVVGDTTTTMIWLAGHSPMEVVHAYIGSAAAFAVLAWCASGQQHRLQPISPDPADAAVRLDWGSFAVVLLILGAAIGTNIGLNLWERGGGSAMPWIGISVWLALLAAAWWRPLRTDSLPGAATGAMFLLCLVLAASLMPVDELPHAGLATTFGLGFVSAVFDNIPLTMLALKQGGYEWGMLAFAVGFGGSMMWFGSSAGVAVASQFPQARSAGLWLRHGWYIPLAYAAGMLALCALLEWPAGRVAIAMLSH